MIIVWRPPLGLNDEFGIEYQKNEVKIKIQKVVKTINKQLK